MPLIQNRNEWYEDVSPVVHGLDLAVPPEQTKIPAATELDWYHDINGELHKCLGRMSRGALPGLGAIRGMFMWYRQDNIKLGGLKVPDQMVVHTTGRMFSTEDFITFTERESGLAGAPGFFVDYTQVIPDDILLMTDGIMLPRQYDGTTVTTFTLPTSVSDAFLVKYYKRRTLLINVFDDGLWCGNRIWFSVGESSVFDDWTLDDGAGFIEYADGGDYIVRAVEFNDTIVLFKRTRIGVLSHTGQADVPFRIQDFPEAIGTIYPWSIDVAPFGVVYLAHDGVRIFDGQKSKLAASDILRQPRYA